MAILRYGGDDFVNADNILYPEIMEYLRNCASEMVQLDRYVALAFCEYKLSDVFPSSYKPTEGLPPNFIVVCIRFIRSNEYQPIGTLFLHNDAFNGYSPSEKELGDCLRLYILAVSKLTFKVVATVSPPTYTFKKALNDLTGIPDVAAYKGPLMYSVADIRDIIHIFDPPSLLKAFRNLFMMMDIEYKMNNKTFYARWKDFNTLHSKGKLPFLDNEHVSPCMKVSHTSYAAELLSTRVSQVITDAIRSGVMSEDAMGTSILVKMFDHLFESFNSVIGENHMSSWDKGLKLLDTITFLNRHGDPESKIPGVARGLYSGSSYYSSEDTDPGDSVCGSSWKLLQEFGRLDKNLNTQISMMQKIQTESAQGRLRVVSDELLYKPPYENERRKLNNSETSSNAINEKIENKMRDVDGKIEIPLLKCTADVRLSRQAQLDKLQTKKQTVETLKKKLEDIDFDNIIPNMESILPSRSTQKGNKRSGNAEKSDKNSNHAQKNDNTPKSAIPYDVLGIPLINNKEDWKKYEESLKAGQSKDSSPRKNDKYIHLDEFIAESAKSGVNHCYGYIEESDVGKEDKSEHTPLLHNEGPKTNYNSTDKCNIECNKDNDHCPDKHQNLELESRKPKTAEDEASCNNHDPNKNSSNTIVDERQTEREISDESDDNNESYPLNNTIDKSKPVHSSVKQLNVYTENDTNSDKNLSKEGKTDLKKVNVEIDSIDENECSDKMNNLSLNEVEPTDTIKTDKSIEDRNDSSVAENPVQSTIEKLSKTGRKDEHSTVDYDYHNNRNDSNSSKNELSVSKEEKTAVKDIIVEIDSHNKNESNDEINSLTTSQDEPLNKENIEDKNDSSVTESITSSTLEKLSKMHIKDEYPSLESDNQNAEIDADSDNNESSASKEVKTGIKNVNFKIYSNNESESSDELKNSTLNEDECVDTTTNKESLLEINTTCCFAKMSPSAVIKHSKMHRKYVDSDDQSTENDDSSDKNESTVSKEEKTSDEINHTNINENKPVDTEQNEDSTGYIAQSPIEKLSKMGPKDRHSTIDGCNNKKTKQSTTTVGLENEPHPQAKNEEEENKMDTSSCPNDAKEKFQIPDSVKKSPVTDNLNISTHPMTKNNVPERVHNISDKPDRGIQEVIETPVFESDSEIDMPSIPISDILEKLEAPDKRSEMSEKPLVSDHTLTPQASNADDTFKNHEIINNWMASVEGIQRIVRMLEDRGVKQINAKAFGVDCIHDYICDARKSNELNVAHRVSPNSPFKMFHEFYGVLAMVRGSVQLMKS